MFNTKLARIFTHYNYLNNNFTLNTFSSKTFKDIPGPKAYPFIGSLLQLKDFGGSLNILEFRNFQIELQKKYGDIVRWEFLGEKNVYLYDPELIKQSFKYDGTSPFRSQLGPLLVLSKKLGIKLSLSNSQGERWRNLRSLSNPCMAKPKTIYSYINNQNQVANDLIKIINKKFHFNSNVYEFKKFDHLLRLLALEYVSEIAFDKRLKCIDEENRLSDVSQLVEEILAFFVYAGRLLFSFPIWRIYPTNDWIKFEKAGRFIYKVVGEYIRQAEEINKTSSKQTILKGFLERKEKYGFTREDVVGLMIDFLIAGVDTTATSIYYLFYELGVNQDIQEKLYQEIKTVIGDDKNISEEYLEKMKYLKCVVKESMRIHSTVPANSRVLSEDTQVGDYLLEKGTNVVFCNSYIIQCEKYFKNANKFDPERWIRDANMIHPYATLSFGFGARMCVGRRIAEQEIYLTLIKILQNYRIEYKESAPGLKIGLIASPDKHLNIMFHKR